MSHDVIRRILPLAMPWQTADPFLFCMHHDDAYPMGNEKLGPRASLAGRQIGMDFAGKDGWNMYHGDVVPGFPSHPHRGFETVTLVRKGLIDHSDSLGATARFGRGDVQWLTAGKGIVHSEMFPLVNADSANPTELFQVWLNLPAAKKMVTPHFSMLWGETIPVHEARDAEGRLAKITIVAGALRAAAGVVSPPRSPPESWASDPAHDVAIWTIWLDPNATWTVPAAAAGTNRALYFFRGSSLRVADRDVPRRSAIFVEPDAEVTLAAGPEGAELLLLQGKPIAEPVVQHGPFVMTSPAEIQQAFSDFRRTGFGGWPWEADGPVHARTRGRFARHPNGREEDPQAGSTNTTPHL